MATATETRVVYAAGVVQGIALVTFPAASTILTDPAESFAVAGRRPSPASVHARVSHSPQ
jgi:hypothetical protein